VSSIGSKLGSSVGSKLRMMVEQPRVMVATPMTDTCLADYCRSVVKMVAYSIAKGLVIGHEIVQYSMIPLSRNQLVKRAIETNATHILFIDSDMEFPPELAVDLVKHHKPIVAINCMARRRPYYLTARTEASEEVLTSEESSGLEKVARVGTGIVLINLSVFKTVPEPWFEYVWLPEKDCFRGEDFVFCDKARAAGHEIYIDHDLSKKVSHVGSFRYTPLLRVGFAEAEQEHREAERAQA